MATKANYKLSEIGAGKVGFPRTGEAVTNTRAIVEAALRHHYLIPPLISVL